MIDRDRESYKKKLLYLSSADHEHLLGGEDASGLEDISFVGGHDSVPRTCVVWDPRLRDYF